MMKSLQKTTCALAVMAVTASSAFAADSVDLKVTGTITPVACKPVLGGGGAIDYGAIAANTLSKDSYTVLDAKTVDFSITCDAPAKVAIMVTSSRTAAPGVTTFGDSGFGPAPDNVVMAGLKAPYVTGLGGDGKTGGYNLKMLAADILLDGTGNVHNIWKYATSPNWSNDETNNIVSNNKTHVTWADTGSLTPKAFTTMSGKITAQAYINKASELDLTQPVTLDGLSTIELVYL